MTTHPGKPASATRRALLKASVLCSALLAASTTATQAATPVNPSANTNTWKVLNWLSALPERPTARVLVAHNLGHGDEINTTSHPDWLFQNTYDQYVGQFHSQTGKYPAMLGLDYAFLYAYPTAKILTANTKLKEAWNQGSLITINWTPANPWTGAYSGDTSVGRHRLNELYRSATASAHRTAFWSHVDIVAAGLADLQTAGVVVLFRPMQEMDGHWFWYGIRKNNNEEPTYPDWLEHTTETKQLLSDLYTYLTVTKGLNNLLWLYSPTAYGGNNYYTEGKWDIIAPTLYDNTFNTPGAGLAAPGILARYDSFSSTGRVHALGEVGPIGTPNAQGNNWNSGGFDNRKYIQDIRTNAPETVYFNAWSDWRVDGQIHASSLTRNWFLGDLVNDPWVIDRSEVNWRDFTPANRLRNGGFEFNAKSTQTPSQWKTWSSTPAGQNADQTVSSVFSGNFCLQHFATSAYDVYTYQTITGLPNGVYSLRAKYNSTGGQSVARMEVADHVGTQTIMGPSLTTSTAGAWVDTAITGFTVSTNKVEVGFYSVASANQGLWIDDVVLTREAPINRRVALRAKSNGRFLTTSANSYATLAATSTNSNATNTRFDVRLVPGGTLGGAVNLRSASNGKFLLTNLSAGAGNAVIANDATPQAWAPLTWTWLGGNEVVLYSPAAGRYLSSSGSVLAATATTYSTAEVFTVVDLAAAP